MLKVAPKPNYPITSNILPPEAKQSVWLGIAFLALSAFLFSGMGVFIRAASHSVDNASIVFFRNAVGLICLLPFFAIKGFSHLKTDKIMMHFWRAAVGLAAMYCFFYAIGHLKLSNAMVFTYSSPVFIPLVAKLFLKEKMTRQMMFAALLGFAGVLLVAKPDTGILNLLSLIGMASSFLAAIAFVTVRGLTGTEPATRIVFYFCLISTVLSGIPMLWLWRAYSVHELVLLACAGSIATLSQICLSKAYGYAPAGKIGPINYLAIIFAGLWAALLWQEYPDCYGLLGMVIILLALLLNMPRQKTWLDNTNEKIQH